MARALPAALVLVAAAAFAWVAEVVADLRKPAEDCGSKGCASGGGKESSLQAQRVQTKAAASGNCKDIGCFTYDPSALCQCNAKCLEMNNCCIDFADTCITGESSTKSVVGDLVSTQALCKFWACAFAWVAMGVMVIGCAFNKDSLVEVSQRRTVHTAPEEKASDNECHESDDSEDEPEDLPGEHVNDILQEGVDPESSWGIVYHWWGMYYRDPVLEDRFERTTKAQRISDGAAACVAGISLLGVILFGITQTTCIAFWARISTYANVCLAIILLIACSVCVRVPRERIFWPMVIAFFVYLPAQCMAPLGMSCWELKNYCAKDASSWMLQHYRHVDCSMQGQSCVQLLMTWILLTPWILPRTDYMQGLWVWVIAVFIGWTFTYRLLMHEDVYHLRDILYRVVLLVVVTIAACRNKYMLERLHRMKFKHDIQQENSSRKMFKILDFMMPEHVIVPMLHYPQKPIAASVDVVSILFLVIDEFDHFTRDMTPSQLLNFLNSQFTEIDKVCNRHLVTKIETVGEEYVACVGVLPRDIELNRLHGHSYLLDRLFMATRDLLELQTSKVRYKMGVHTGPIVAGVIGTKLPRYRLFGDTINFAARMMQKGLPGVMQFGESTYNDLSVNFKSEVTFRGEVEMKGKGLVKVWNFLTAARQVDRETIATGASHRSTITRHLYNACAAQSMTVSATTSTDGTFDRPTKKDPPLDRVDSTDKRFDQIKTSMQINEKPQRFLLREKQGFTQKMEEEWRQWHHEKALLYKASRRFATSCFVLMLISMIEMQFLLHMQVWIFPHPLYNRRWRWPVYVFSRILVLLMQMVWWYATTAQWLKTTSWRIIQYALVLTISVSVVVIYAGYDAILFSDSPAITLSLPKDRNFRAPEDQFLSLNFVLLYYVWMRMHSLLFYQALCFIPVTILIVVAPQAYTWQYALDHPWESAFSDKAIFLLFAQTFVNAAISHEDENKSRARFKAQRLVEETSTRTKNILDTLMPPLLVEELRKLPPDSPAPSHQYRHATIAQSDLCGFTQLSSTKTPSEVVCFMSELFGKFDVLTDKWEVYKVETIGDAYIAGMAEPPMTRINSPAAVVLFGLDMVRAVDDWARHLGVKVACRVGVHYGECIGGIVGNAMQRYHLFGNLLVVMDTLEATSIEGRVQVSTACKLEVERQLRDNPLASSEKLTFVPRQDGELKTSKGELHTFEEVGGQTYLIDSDQPLRRTGH